MNFRRITSALFDIGRSSSTLLWYLVRNNFIQHQTRILEFEALTSDLPPGFLVAYGGATAPTGYLLCDGSVIDRTVYADLYAVIGTRYNTGGESGVQFRVPDTRGRVAIGAGSGSGLTARTIGDRVGTELHALTTAEMASHTHALTPANPGHRHSDVRSTSGGSGVWHHSYPDGTAAASAFTTSSVGTGLVVNNSGGGSYHNNLQPSLVVNFIIKT